MRKTGTTPEHANPRFRLTLALAALAASGAVTLACRADEPRRRFDIPAGNAAVRLNELFERLGLTLGCDFAATGVSTTREVHGVYTLKELLARMVDGQNIEFWFPNERTVSCGLRRGRKAEALAAQPPEHAAPKEIAPSPMDQVLVTGTHIPGQSPIGAQLISIGREDIEHSGLDTLHDMLRTLPQVFGGGPSDDTFQIGRETTTNVGKGVGVNLRGLGAGATLLLINGRRIAPSGSEAAFIDAFNIPLSIVDRIDVMPDGGSALYGSNAVGGVVNVVLRHGFDGKDTQARVSGADGGALGEHAVEQTIGGKWHNGNALLSVDYYREDGLPSSSRRQTDSNLTPFGGDNFDTPQSNPGTLKIGTQTWAIPHGQDGTSLAPASFTAGSSNLENLFRGADMIASQQRFAALANAQYTPNDRLDLFVDGFMSRRKAQQNQPAQRFDLPVTGANPFYVNPTGGTGVITVSYDFIDDLGPVATFSTVDTDNVALGANFNIDKGWFLRGYTAYARDDEDVVQNNLLNRSALLASLANSDPSQAFNPFGDGSHTNPAVLEALRGRGTFESRSALQSTHLFVEGPLPAVAGVTSKLAVGAEYRRQNFSTRATDPNFPTPSQSHFDRNVTAGFAEWLVPLADAGRRRPGLERLEFSLAASHERNADVNRTTTPKLGMLWSPLPALTLRSTWTESVRAPNLPDLDESQNVSVVLPLQDAAAPTGTPTLIWVGKNRDLREEHGKAWTFGAQFDVPSRPGTSLALTYFNIEIENRVQLNQLTSDVLLNPQYASLVTRNPSDEERRAVCDRSLYLGLPGTCLTTPIGAIGDLRLTNSALTRTDGLDLNVRHPLQNRFGAFELGLNGTYLLDFSEAASPLAPLRRLADTQNNPLVLQMRGSLSWDLRGLGASLFINHAGSYRDTASYPNRRVDAWTSLDLQLRYRPGAHTGWLRDTRFFLSAQNLFDRYPPFLNNHLGIGYDAENADIRGRVLSLDVRKNW